MGIFYKPEDAVVGDVIPLYHEGRWHLFYLKDFRRPGQRGLDVPWFQVVTRDFVSFEDWGEAIPRGAPGEQDPFIFTGCALEAEGRFHIFYTGHNESFREEGRPVEVIMHATSDDLRHWRKDPDFRLPAGEGYEPDDWRDPFVFWNEEAGEWWMLLAGRLTEGPRRNRGCTALAASPDLEQWEVRAPLWAPAEYFTHECPDLFRWGDWWYLVFSTFSDRFTTHYRMSRSLAGPWLCPPTDSFDGRAHYAAKTAGDGEQRYLCGWLATRHEETDEGGWQWGGNLVAHELWQRPDGTLAVRIPKTVREAFRRPQPLQARPLLGAWEQAGERAWQADAVGRHSALSLGDLPDEALVQTEVTFSPGTAACGLLLRMEGDLEGYYQVRLEPARRRLVLDRWPRPGDQPFMVERPLALESGRPVRLQAVVDGTCLVVYAAGEVAVSWRMYDHRAGQWGLFVTEGEASFSGVEVKTR